MCDYLSAVIHEGRLYADPTLRSHSGARDFHGLHHAVGAELEWTERGIDIRSLDPVKTPERLEGWVRSKWPTRESMRDYLVEQVGSTFDGDTLVALPDGLIFGGFLDLNGCTGLTAIPDGLSVGGSLDLNDCTGLTALPDGLSVGGFLNLYGCTGLTALPDGLSVGGFLKLYGCTGLTALPDGLSVGGRIFLPEHLKHQQGHNNE